MNNKKVTRKDIIRNSFKNNYNIKQDVINAIKNINKEMNEIAEDFYKTNGLFK